MTAPTWFFDGDKLRIYEVPPDSSYTIDANGYRIYTPNNPLTAEAVLYVDIQQDLWSRWIDWHATAGWSLLAFTRSGGASRGFDSLGQEKFQSVDFTLRASVGWRLVLADYHHEIIFTGNLYSDDNGSIFDHARLTSMPPPLPRLEGFADMVTYREVFGSGMSQEEHDTLFLIKDGADFISDIEGGRWVIKNNQQIFYGPDNVTEVARFNLLDVNGNPTETNVYERVRV